MRTPIPGSTGVLLFTTVICLRAAALDGRLEITIHLYDYSGMDRPAAMHARQAADAVLRQAGINVRWEDCLAPAARTAIAPSCGAGTYDVTHLTVAVLPESMSAKFASSPAQFGIATTSREGGFPTQAYVFFDRVANFAKAEMVTHSRLLGLFIAHEVGHLLLGDNSHFPAGIMRARWTSAEVKQALMGVMTFTSGQATQMRAEVRRRMNTNKSDVGADSRKLLSTATPPC